MQFQNPFRLGGSYNAVVEALRVLGIGKMHRADKFSLAFAKAMGPKNFAEFKAVKPRNKNGKPWQERIIQNALVLHRPDYGKPLREVGIEVLKERDKDGYMFGLFPIKGFKPKPQTATPVTKGAGKAAGKAGKGKGKPAKRKGSY
jgi:hypothetical protein